MKIQTFIIEYTRPIDGRVWRTEVESYDRESAINDFEKEFCGLKIRECYLKEEA
jgi:hypothetical protein